MLDLTKMNPIRFLQKVHIIDGQNGEEPFVTSKREDEEVLFLIHNPYYKDLVSEIRELGNVTDKTYLNEKISFLKSTFAKHGSGWDKILKSHLITGIVGYKPLSELRLQEIPENQEVCIYIQSGTTIDDIKD